MARSQERELRQWLFDPVTDVTVLAALQRASGEVEDTFGVRITPVTVGEDIPLDDANQACVLAAREAMVNAAKYAGDSSMQESARQKSIEKELEWVRQNLKGRQAKSKARMAHFEELNSGEYQKRNETNEQIGRAHV